MLSATKKLFVSNHLLASNDGKILIKPSELDIYNEPVETVRVITTESQYPTLFHENVSSMRKHVTKAFSGLLTTHEKVSNLFSFAEQKFYGIYNEALKDPYSLLIPGSITIATIGGAVVAGKGKRPVSRIFYGGLFGTTAAAVTHPQRTLEICTTGYYHTSASISTLKSYWTVSEESITEKVENEVSIDDTSEIVANDVLSEHSGDALFKTTDTEELPVHLETSDIKDATLEVAVNESHASEQPLLINDVTLTEIPVVNNPLHTEVNIENTEITPVSSIDEIETLALIEEESEISNKPETYDSHQNELFVVVEDETGEDNNSQAQKGDYGQSNAEDSDMYSTRS